MTREVVRRLLPPLLVLAMIPGSLWGVARAQASLDKQLLTNPGAEVGMAAPGTSLDVVSIPGWDTKGSNFTVEAYTPEKDMYGIEQARINGGGAFFIAGSDGGGLFDMRQVASIGNHGER